ncbi:MAG: transporter substrate-binding domain-containing protein [Desulfobacterales bacterium]|nr:transporter substrate-binding domain-containing protein [Desulfobacterales bacterium]
MKIIYKSFSKTWIYAIAIIILISLESAFGSNIEKIKQRGVLRHLGIPYANFVTGAGDGMDVELVQLFAQYLKLEYRYIETSWEDVVGDLCGQKVRPKGEDVEILGTVPIKGDMIASGFSILPWRQKVLDYSIPTFPSQIWLIAQADSSLKPIKPSGNIDQDISAVKTMLKGKNVIGVADTCLDPSLLGLEAAGAKIIFFTKKINEIAPAVINGESEAALLEVPDALIALEKWPGKIKVIGPLSQTQYMGYAFAKTSDDLCEAFNCFLEKCRKDGFYLQLVKKYYPTVFTYYPDFFEKQ